MEIDEKLIKVSAGQIVVDGDLEQDQEVVILIKGNVTKIEYKSNQDGTSNKVCTVKGYLAEIVYKRGDEVKREELE